MQLHTHIFVLAAVDPLPTSRLPRDIVSRFLFHTAFANVHLLDEQLLVACRTCTIILQPRSVFSIYSCNLAAVDLLFGTFTGGALQDGSLLQSG